MRDLLSRKFETAARGMGFHPVPQADARGVSVFIADDGLRIDAVVERDPRWTAHRINRRATLAAMSAARKQSPRMPGVRYDGNRIYRNNEEAPGATTPRASV